MDEDGDTATEPEQQQQQQSASSPPSPSSPSQQQNVQNNQQSLQHEPVQHQNYPLPMYRMMGAFQAPNYVPVSASSDTEADNPGPRCAHTLTAVVAVGEESTPGYIGQRLLLFGGVTVIDDGSSASGPQPRGGSTGIRLEGVTNDVHAFDVVSSKWTRLHPVGEPPSPRAAHAATAVGSMVVIQGGIGPAGHATEDLHVLDLTHAKPKWHRVVVQGPGPGPRYGHVMALVAQRYLITVGGNDGKRPLSDAWALDTASKPYEWRKLDPEGDGPPPCMYATASARADGLLLLCGGRDANSVPLATAYALLKHRDGRWEWSLAPGTAPSPRYQHAAVFVDSRLHVSGGALRGGRMVEGAACSAVLDTNASLWLDQNGIVTSPRISSTNSDASRGDTYMESTRRCRHAAAAVDKRIFLYGGLRGDILLDDLLVAEDLAEAETTPAAGRGTEQFSNRGISMGPVVASANGSTSMDIGSDRPQRVAGDIDSLVEASAAEAEAISATFRAARAAAASHGDGETDQPMSEDGGGTGEPGGMSQLSPKDIALQNHISATDVRLHHRAVVVAQEPGGALGGLVRQLSLDQFENEGRRVIYGTPDSGNAAKRLLDRQISSRGLHKKIISNLLKPRGWKPSVIRQFFMDANDVVELCDTAQQIFAREPTVLKLRAPLKLFGDLHGQFGDLMRLFNEYGFPSTAGDITYIDYLFLGDYVDRGQHSLETITLLLALKIEYPEHVHLIRGNHEAADINALFGFRIECIERMGEKEGIWAWHRFNQLFNWLPLAALIENKIICMHGGIGRSINYVEQIESLPRPITMDAGSIVLMDLLWSDPTENDGVEGLRPNARGPGLVTFGPDRVLAFCKNNNLQMIIRAHECVMDGFERFAQGHLITLFSATNYCGSANNAGAILVLGRDLVVVPKLIHPIPPAIISPEASPDRYFEETWMQELNAQRPPTPTRGRPNSSSDRSSLAWI